MNKFSKIGIVIVGYICAIIGAFAAVYVNSLFIQDPNAASSGMSAFSDALLFVMVCGGLAIVPTLLAIYFLFRGFLKSKSIQKNNI
ncbi:MAG: hypothetical protein JNK81_04595 [Anaerolineales bacterium]|nr:hypothetical protein [Anaerolineales bacterium]